jgi:Regulator of volume decrease after cellular swelling
MVIQVGDASIAAISSADGTGLEEGEEEKFRLTGATVTGLELPEQTSGDLVITTRRLCWWSDSVVCGASVPFADIGLHAVSRDPATGTGPCIYAQVGDGDDELRVFLANESELEGLFAAMCEAAALCLDGEEGEGEFGGEPGEMFTTTDTVSLLDGMLQVNGFGDGNGAEENGDDYDEEEVSEGFEDKCRFDDVDRSDDAGGSARTPSA